MGKVVGFELSSQEPEKAAKFYSDVFGWEISEPHWDYWAVSAELAVELVKDQMIIHMGHVFK